MSCLSWYHNPEGFILAVQFPPRRDRPVRGSMYNVISDIAGNFKALQALLAKMPDGKVLSVGDMIDRGPRSREVVDFFMGGGGEALRGNHEDFCLQYHCPTGRYAHDDWAWNGGTATIDSFGIL